MFPRRTKRTSRLLHHLVKVPALVSTLEYPFSSLPGRIKALPSHTVVLCGVFVPTRRFISHCEPQFDWLPTITWRQRAPQKLVLQGAPQTQNAGTIPHAASSDQNAPNVTRRAYPAHMSWRDAPGEGKTERSRMPYMQISTDQWAVIRESLEHPKAIIQQVTARDQTARYLLYTWHPDPVKRRLHGMFDTIEEANREVSWSNPRPSTPGMPDQMRQARRA